MAHDWKTCRDCAELNRTGELLGALGFDDEAIELVSVDCPADGGKPVDVSIEDATVKVDAKRRAAKMAEKAPIGFGPGGPPVFELTTAWKRFSTFTDADVDVALKIIRATESLPFMRKAVETVYTYIHGRLEALNEKEGFERDGRLKAAETAKTEPVPAVTKESAEPRPYTPPVFLGADDGRPSSSGLITEINRRALNAVSTSRMSRIRLWRRNDLTKAKLMTGVKAGDYFRITHSSDIGQVHEYIATRGTECPACGKMPRLVEIISVADLNRHGTPRTKHAAFFREEWDE